MDGHDVTRPRTTGSVLLLSAFELAISVLIFDALRLSIGLAFLIVPLDLWDIFWRDGSPKYMLVTTPWPLLGATTAAVVSHTLQGWTTRGVTVVVAAVTVALVATISLWALQRGRPASPPSERERRPTA
jgi:hypothetical protein